MTSSATPETGDSDTPAWVANVREEIGRSPAWEVLSDHLYERVSTILQSHGLGHFSDLSHPEQVALLEEAHREISSEDNMVYQAFESQFSKSMDAEIAKEARSRVDKDKAAKRDGTDEALYLDRVLESAAEGAVSLLKELPLEHLGSLRLMLNQPIPSRVRLDIWQLLLKHTAARQEYQLLMKQNRNSTISVLDIYITHRCQALLESGRVAERRLLPLTSRNVVLMKTVLSYHHACKMTKRGEKPTSDIPEPFVHFLVPLCAVTARGAELSSSSPSANSSNAAAAAPNLVEQTIEDQIEELLEMFEGALEAGLEGLVGLKGSHKGVGGGGAGIGRTTQLKKSVRETKVARVAEVLGSEGAGTGSGGGGGGGGGDGGTGDKSILPAWVDHVHGVLIPGFQDLLDHITRVHLGLAVAPEGGVPGHKQRQVTEGSAKTAAGGASRGSPDGEGAEQSNTVEGTAPAGTNSREKMRDQRPSDDGNAQSQPAEQTGSATSRPTLLAQSRARPPPAAANDSPVSTGLHSPGGGGGGKEGNEKEKGAHGDTDSGDAGNSHVVGEKKLSATANGMTRETNSNGREQEGKEEPNGKSTAQSVLGRKASATSRRASLLASRRGTLPSSAYDGNSAPNVRAAAGSESNFVVGNLEEGEATGDILISQGEGAAHDDETLSGRSDTSTNTRSSIVAPLAAVDEAQTRSALWALLNPLITVGLVGYLGADACLFAWDQAVIGGFGVMLPRMAAMVVAAAADKIRACVTFAVMSEALFSHAHLVSTSQLQELMEAHCMASIRKETRVSHKLSPEITGPSLKTATDIFDSAYSKSTREAQKARKAHVEHVLGPSKGGPVNDTDVKKRLQLDLRRDATRGFGGGSKKNGGRDANLPRGGKKHDDGVMTTREESASGPEGFMRGGPGEADLRGKMLPRSLPSPLLASASSPAPSAQDAVIEAPRWENVRRREAPAGLRKGASASSSAQQGTEASLGPSDNESDGSHTSHSRTANSETEEEDDEEEGRREGSVARMSGTIDHESSGGGSRLPSNQRGASRMDEKTGGDTVKPHGASASAKTPHLHRGQGGKQTSTKGADKAPDADEAAQGKAGVPNKSKRDESSCSTSGNSSPSYSSQSIRDGYMTKKNREESTKGTRKAREAKQIKDASTAGNTSRGGNPAAAASSSAQPAGVSSASSSHVSPLTRWLGGLRGRLKTSPSQPPTVAPRPARPAENVNNNDLSGWMND